MRASRDCFIRQQGFTTPNPDRNLYEALMLQPRIIAGLAVIGVLLQSAWLFLALAAVLWWGTFLPTQNLFDAIYNHLVARPRGLPRLDIAPEPRRFAQGLAGVVAFAIGAALLSKAALTARILEGVFLWAVMAVVVGRVCAGANLYHLLRRASASAAGDQQLARMIGVACESRRPA
jgi:hypothetical protein